MTDPQRNAIVEAGLDEEEILDLVTQTGMACGYNPPFSKMYRTEKRAIGHHYWRTTPSQILKTMSVKIMNETGVTESEAVDLACREMEKIIEISEAQGVQAARAYVGYTADPESVAARNLEWQKEGFDPLRRPFYLDKEIETPMDAIKSHVIQRSLEMREEMNRENARELRAARIEAENEAFFTGMKMKTNEVLRQREKAQVYMKIADVQISINKLRRESSQAIRKHQRQEKVRSFEQKLDKYAKTIGSKSHEARFKNFWASEEGKKRRQEIIEQGALMSLAARRMNGLTKGRVPRKIDVQAAERSFEKLMEKGTVSRTKAIQAIHDARIYGVYRHMADKNPGTMIDKAFIDKAIKNGELKKIPTVKETYQELTGTAITAKQAQQEFLKQTKGDASHLVDERDRAEAGVVKEFLKNREIDPEKSRNRVDVDRSKGLITDEDLQQLRELRDELARRSAERRNGIDMNAPENKGLVTSEDIETRNDSRRDLDRMRFHKTADPVDQDMKDQKELSDMGVDKALDRAESNFRRDRHGETNLEAAIVQERAKRKLDRETPISTKEEKDLEKQHMIDRKLEAEKRHREEELARKKDQGLDTDK